jgi:dolichol-phosphate mannosyltransferase
MKKVIAMIPTYNEAGHIGALIREVLAQDPRLEVLVVDDDSPDGTWRVVEAMARGDRRVSLLRRTRGRGRGWAGAAGLREALAMGADGVVEMDGDYSHRPQEIPGFLEAGARWDVVVGSRSMPGGRDNRSGAARGWITRLAAAYVRRILAVPVSDPTSGYRFFRKEALERMGLERLRSRGPAVVEEILYACRRAGLRIGEIPIRFDERRSGRSKLTVRILLETVWAVAWIRFGGRWGTS